MATADDQCRSEPEDWDGFEDGDGCPDRDNDDDDVPDADDACPGVVGDGDPSGCPGVDAARRLDGDAAPGDGDDDGVLDDEDRCATQPEDLDGFEDDDGCPDGDNDRDGFADAADRCPNQRPTSDGPRSTDGCPTQWSCAGTWTGNESGTGIRVQIDQNPPSSQCGKITFTQGGAVCAGTLRTCTDGKTFRATYACAFTGADLGYGGQVELACTSPSVRAMIGLDPTTKIPVQLTRT